MQVPAVHGGTGGNNKVNGLPAQVLVRRLCSPQAHPASAPALQGQVLPPWLGQHHLPPLSHAADALPVLQLARGEPCRL